MWQFNVQYDTNHTCEICEKVFNSKKKLKNHFSLVHDNRGKLFNCNICTKSFEIQSKLTFHIKNYFMKEGKLTNVALVANHFLAQVI